MTTLEVKVRTDAFGKGAARKLRAAGRLPAVIYGPGGGAVSLSVCPKALVEIFKVSENRNTVLELNLDGGPVQALVRSVQRHPVTRELLHVDFYRVDEAREVEVMVPVNPVGRPEGATLGGRLRLIRRELRARCKPGDIPVSFDVDVSHMNINDIVLASEIPLPEGVALVLDSDINVLTLYGSRRAMADEEGEDAEEEATGEEASEEAEA